MSSINGVRAIGVLLLSLSVVSAVGSPKGFSRAAPFLGLALGAVLCSVRDEAYEGKK